MFTFADGSHVGYSAPGGQGVHLYEDDFGNQWEIQFHPEGFRVYRRWFEEEALEGDFKVVEWTPEEAANEQEIKNGLVE